jgi:hypothetical protein
VSRWRKSGWTVGLIVVFACVLIGLKVCLEFENDVDTTPEKVRAGFAGALEFVECYILLRARHH